MSQRGYNNFLQNQETNCLYQIDPNWTCIPPLAQIKQYQAMSCNARTC